MLSRDVTMVPLLLEITALWQKGGKMSMREFVAGKVKERDLHIMKFVQKQNVSETCSLAQMH